MRLYLTAAPAVTELMVMSLLLAEPAETEPTLALRPEPVTRVAVAV